MQILYYTERGKILKTKERIKIPSEMFLIYHNYYHDDHNPPQYNQQLKHLTLKESLER